MGSERNVLYKVRKGRFFFAPKLANLKLGAFQTTIFKFRLFNEVRSEKYDFVFGLCYFGVGRGWNSNGTTRSDLRMRPLFRWMRYFPPSSGGIQMRLRWRFPLGLSCVGFEMRTR